MILAFIITVAAFVIIVISLAKPSWDRHNEEAANPTRNKKDAEDWRLKVKTVDVTGNKRKEEEEEETDRTEKK